MANVNGGSQASFRWMLSCATMGLAASVSLCFAQGDRDTATELQRVQPFACDSLDPKVCLDIYQRRMEQLPERTPENKASPGGLGQVIDAFGNLHYDLGTPSPFGGYDYTLRPILFVVPHGDKALQESRRKDAEALRSRFTTCDTGLLFAGSLRDVAIREPITKNSSHLVPALRQILDKTGVGHLTPPETTAQGIELFALCEKKETPFYGARRLYQLK
jgi:hypothetical protein